MEKLFIENIHAPDNSYNNIRDREHFRDGRDFIEQLWQIYKTYADPHFSKEIQNNFHARFWELYLACTLIENGFPLSKLKGIGPDILIENNSQKIWIEAITPTSGTKENDRVPEIKHNEVFDYPKDKIILRYTNAISTKYNCFSKNFEKGIIKEGDAFIIAINASKIDYPDSNPPLILRSVIPIGDLSILIDTKTKAVIDRTYTYTDSVKKATGELISTKIFMNPFYDNL